MNHAETFWSNTRKSGECWLWLGATTSGYGQVHWRGRVVYAHRLAYELANKKPPGSLHVCHECDNRACVNPSHLFLGTVADNMADRDAKNRQARGEGHGRAKLTGGQVLLIRQAATSKSQRAIARNFGVSQRLVGMILRREAWRHLP